MGVARAYECVCRMGRLVTVDACPAKVANAILRVEFEPTPLLTALDALATLVTDNARENAAQVRVCLCACITCARVCVRLG